ncbi:MAG TPA: hypothetical protein VF159_00040 [Gemmatimonadaceae bacterium]
MIWCFTRNQAQLDIEVSRAVISGDYVLTLTSPDGTERVERFSAPERLITRVLDVQRDLITNGWMPTSPAGPQVFVRRPSLHRARHVRALHALAHLHRTIAQRLAAAFGL